MACRVASLQARLTCREARYWTYVNTLDKKSRKIMLLFLVPHPPFAVVLVSSVWASADTLDGEGGASANSTAVFLPLLPTTPRKAKMTEIYGNFFLFPFARHNTGDFSKCKKWAQKNRKPFHDFLSWYAVLCSGGYSVLMYGCSSKRNLNRAAISRRLMLSSVSLLTCPFSREASRISY